MPAIRILVPFIALAAVFTGALSVNAQNEAFAAADKNADGALDQAEFRAFIDQQAADGKPNAVKIKSSGRYGTAFGRIDKNGDGRITPDELSSAR
ncbi:MAG: hypothetical protein ACOYJQ_01905 [Pseudochelatococcus sp.]|uniref:hypothetical protein n=1 Tax=Pseudochelatococcus sp. TaxID=2020869 RepID=UPI003D8A7893